MLKFKVIYLSFKIKFLKFFKKNYDPYNIIKNKLNLSPSLIIKEFQELNVKNTSLKNLKNKKNILQKLLNLDKKIKNLRIIYEKKYELKNDIIRNKIYLKFSKYRDFPIDILIKKNNLNPKAIIICLQGANSGAHLNYEKIIMPNDYIKVKNKSGNAIHASLNNCIAVSYERIGYGERKEKKIKTKNSSVSTYNIDPSLSFMLFGKTLIGESINELNSLTIFLKKKFNNLPIYVIGYSDGGALAMAFSALNDKIDGVAISGCVGSFRDTVLKRTQTGLLNVPSFLNYFDMGVFLELIASRYCLIISAVDDHIWPYRLTKKVFDEVRNIYKNKNIKFNCKLVKVQGGHKYYPNELWDNLIYEINKNESK